MQSIHYWQLFAGIAAFLFAMTLLEDSLKNLSGRAFKKFLQRQTAHKVKALASGTIITAILQSSSVVILMVLSFVGAGIVPMRNALAVVLGSNLGTTFNSWIIATVGFRMQLDSLAYPLLAICLIAFIGFPRNKTMRYASFFVVGIALLFVGLDWMKASTQGLENNVQFQQYLGYSNFWFIVIGFIITIILQSSAATFALTLTAVQANIIPLPVAACLVIGSELGTTIKIVIGSLAGAGDQKKVATINFMFNLVTTVVAAIFISPMLGLIHYFPALRNPFTTLAAFQSLMNFLTILIFFPFLKYIANWMEDWFSNHKSDVQLKFIQLSAKPGTDGSLGMAEKEIIELLKYGIEFNGLVLKLENGKQKEKLQLKTFLRRFFRPDTPADVYNRLKALQGEILDYLVELTNNDLSPDNFERCDKLINASRYVIAASKNIKDIQQDLRELRTSANDNLFAIFQTIRIDEQQFLEKIERAISGGLNTLHQQTVDQWETNNQKQQKIANDLVLKLLNEDKIEQMNASTMLNVHRAIYSAHKRILAAVKNLLPSNGGV